MENGTRPQGRPRADVAKRFWAKVDTSGDCWEWLGAKQRLGYGKFYLDGKYPVAHRVAYELTNGAVPPKADIDHLCRNPSCVNPDHLEAVSHRENTLRGANGFALTGRCKSGKHEATEENVYTSPAGKRRCIPCRAEYEQATGRSHHAAREIVDGDVA